jgi:hypothetical protein
MLPDTEILFDAGRLIQWALQPRVHPVMKADYQQLLDRYRDQVPFRECVQAICAGLGIEISAVGPMGMVLTATDDSIFAMTSTDYRRSGNADDRLIDGLILVAILATMYPRAQDLEEDAQVVRPSIAVEDVEKTLRTICKQLETASQHQPDPSVQDLAAGLVEAWQAYRDRVATRTASNSRAALGTTLQMIQRAFDMLERQACVTITVRDGKKRYLPTWKYQVMVRETSVVRLAGMVRKLGVPEEE